MRSCGSPDAEVGIGVAQPAPGNGVLHCHNRAQRVPGVVQDNLYRRACKRLANAVHDVRIGLEDAILFPIHLGQRRIVGLLGEHEVLGLGRPVQQQGDVVGVAQVDQVGHCARRWVFGQVVDRLHEQLSIQVQRPGIIGADRVEVVVGRQCLAGQNAKIRGRRGAKPQHIDADCGDQNARHKN